MSFFGHIFSAIFLPVLAVAGFLFGGHTIPQTPPAVPIVQEASTSPATTSHQVVSVSQNINRPSPVSTTTQNSVSSVLTSSQAEQQIKNLNNQIGQLKQQLSSPIQNQTSSSSQQPPPDTILCNGTYLPACPTGQELVCSTDGTKSYCQVPPPPATATQLAGVALLCSFSTSQGLTVDIQACNDGTMLNGYNTNAIFRSNINTLIQELQQKQAAMATQQANCNFFTTPYNSSISPAANLLDGQIAFAEEQACMAGGTTAAWQQEQEQVQKEQTNYQLQQLQSSVAANTAALQQQQEEQAAQQAAQQLQKEQQAEQQAANPTAQTHCGIDAGVFSCNIPN